MSSKKQHLISGMTPKTAKRYVKIRHKVDHSIGTIYAIADFLSLFSDFTKHDVTIEPYSLAYLAKVVKKESCRIAENLDDGFVSLIDMPGD